MVRRDDQLKIFTMMKKLMLIGCFAIFSFACNDETDTTTTNTTTDSVSETSERAAPVYSPSEGDVTYRSGKLLVYRNNQWVEADRDVELDGDVVVRKDGRIFRDTVEVDLEEGEVVTKAGRVLDKTGNAIEKGWKKTKEGVKKGYKKAKEEVKEVVKDNDE